jgi:hypothetical protein
MYNKIVSIPLIVIGICLIVFFPDGSCLSGWQIAGIVVASFGGLWMFVSIINTMDAASTQMEKFKKIMCYQQNLSVAINYKDKVEKEFKIILTKEFPDFEKDLLKSFSFANEKDKDAFLAICPKLESGDSFMNYVNILSHSMEEIKKLELLINEELKEIAFYTISPWLWFRIATPANVKALLDKFEQSDNV